MNEGGAQAHQFIDAGQQIKGQFIAEPQAVRLVLVQRDGGLATPVTLIVLDADFVVLQRITAGSLATDLHRAVGRHLAVAQFVRNQTVFIAHLQQAGNLIPFHTHSIVIIGGIGIDLLPGMVGTFRFIAYGYGQIHGYDLGVVLGGIKQIFVADVNAFFRFYFAFIDRGAKICCYTDHQIFERYHRVTMRSENARRGKAIMTLKEINQLQVGDYVVHVDHGIGQFAGLVTTHFNGRSQETIKLVYRNNDTIFVSIHNLHRIAKYKGKDSSTPTISRLGSGAWERMKERTKDKVKEIARDLIQLYATRKQQAGFAFSPDGYMQHELEASFLYEDTPDQITVTEEVKYDTSDELMDIFIKNIMLFFNTRYFF